MISLSLFCLAAVVIGLALFVWRARPESRINRWFAAFTMAVGAWMIGIGGLYSGAYLEAWARLTFASASLIPTTFLYFAYCYPEPSRWPSLRSIQATLAASGAFALLSLVTPLIVYEPGMTAQGITRKPGPLYPLFAMYFILAFGGALGIYRAKWRQARGAQRTQLQYLGAAVLLSGSGAIAVNLLTPLVTGTSSRSWIGPYFGLILVGLVAHAIIRHRLMDLRLVVHRGLTLATAILVSLLPVAVVMTLAWPRLALHLEPHELVVVLAAIAVVSL